jgi:hypothetical protein
MVELSIIRDLVAIFGVIAGFSYYVLTVRANQRNTRITLTNSIMQTMVSEEAQRRWIELMNMEWSDYDDFEKKYGSDVNPENYAKRSAVWNSYNMLGNLLMKNIIDAETFYMAGGTWAIFVWEKFKSVLMEHRRRYGSADSYTGLEYLASEMFKIRKQRDPNYQIPKTFTKYIPEKQTPP